MKFATVFSGGGGYDVGMMAAGLEPAWGIEMDYVAANLYEINVGHHMIRENVLGIDVEKYADDGTITRVDLLHFSPPCPRFSTANPNGGESDEDIALANKSCEFIFALRPRIVTIENVLEYRDSRSMDVFLKALYRSGYSVQVFNVNMANYGVPQTRKRMIAVARTDKTPMLPWQTHDQNPKPGLFSNQEKWVGWYDAIKDIVDELPDDSFAKWQLKLLPNDFRTILVPGANGTSFPYRDADEPSFVITDTKRANVNRAFVELQHNSREATVRFADQPATSVSVSGISRPSHQRIIDRGRTVRMISRAHARFQGFPDTYVFPKCSDKQAARKLENYRVWGKQPNTLGKFAHEHVFMDDTAAALVIGNAIPPLFAQRLGEKFMSE